MDSKGQLAGCPVCRTRGELDLINNHEWMADGWACHACQIFVLDSETPWAEWDNLEEVEEIHIVYAERGTFDIWHGRYLGNKLSKRKSQRNEQ